MEILTSCNTSTLDAYVPSSANPWNAKKVNHVFRRLFKTRKQYEAEGLEYNEAVQNNHRAWRTQFIDDMLANGLRDRLTLFWSNHFVTELSVYYCSHFLYQYYEILQRNALGNFQDFVREIGTSGAMLSYLNGFENSLYNANENYARELYELFTLGENNGYTQTDIVETSKALTGYNHWDDRWCSNMYFIPEGEPGSTFNGEDKTIFGQTGNWGYDDVIDILFQEKAPLIALHICTKLYRYFISPNVNDDIVAQMATSFQTDWNIGNVLSTLFKSEHFFDEKAVGSQIKSPYDFMLNYLKVTGFTMNDDHKRTLFYFGDTVGQRLFDPINVAGWQEDQVWINSSTLTGRWQAMSWMVWKTWGYEENGEKVYREQLRTFAIESSGNSNDPFVVTKSIIDRFVPKELHTSVDYDNATDVFKYTIPQNYYDDGIWDLYWDQATFQVVLLLLHISRMPELQIK